MGGDIKACVDKCALIADISRPFSRKCYLIYDVAMVMARLLLREERSDSLSDRSVHGLVRGSFRPFGMVNIGWVKNCLHRSTEE